MKSLSRQSLEEQTRLVSRYVAGDLSRSERAEFEAWLIASPELAAEVEMERRLRRGIVSAAKRGWIQREAPVSLRERPWRIAAIAAGMCLAVTLTLTLGLPRGADSEVASSGSTTRTRAAASPFTVALNSMRGSTTSPDISLTLANLPSSLIVEPNVVVLTCADGTVQFECAGGVTPQLPQYAEYELDIVSQRGHTLAWRSPRQAPLAQTQLSFTLQDPARLEAGDYDVSVRGVSQDHAEVVARYWLRVTQ